MVDGGVLSGHGLVRSDLSNSGEIRPGASAGGLNLVGAFHADRLGKPGGGSDRSRPSVARRGSVSLDGSLELLQADQAPLRAEFVLLDNDDSDAIHRPWSGCRKAPTFSWEANRTC
jgi:hypothetical protein